MPYHGLGSGIKRALTDWSQIDFHDDHDGCLFTVTIHRKSTAALELKDISVLKVHEKDYSAPLKRKFAPLTDFQVQLLDYISVTPGISYDRLVELTQKDRTTIMRNISKLKDVGILKRIGSRKTGHWVVIS